jgi:RNA polymerase sigma-70 factor (ECF subfamily)
LRISINGGRLSSARPAETLSEWSRKPLPAQREQLDDRALIARILEGDRDLFNDLVARYQKRVVNYVYRITHRYEDAHDLAQEIFVKVFLALDRYDPKFQFSTWLFRIAQNSAIDALRKKSISEVSLMRTGGGDDEETKEREFADDGVSPYRALSNKQMAAAIEKAVAELPPDYRELIQLRHYAELSYEEIASMKKLPLGTVKNKLFRARNLLKEQLDTFLEPI